MTPLPITTESISKESELTVKEWVESFIQAEEDDPSGEVRPQTTKYSKQGRIHKLFMKGSNLQHGALFLFQTHASSAVTLSVMRTFHMF